MNTIYFRKSILILLFLGLFIACNEDEDSTEKKIKGSYIVAFEEKPVGKGNPVDYLLQLNSLEELKKGEISVKGRGIPLIGWRFFHKTDNTIFTIGYGQDQSCTSYNLDDKKGLVKKNKFTFDKYLNFLSSTKDGKMIGAELDGGSTAKRRFFITNANTGKIEKIIKHDLDVNKGRKENEKVASWVTGMVHKGNKLYVSYLKISPDNKYITVDGDRAYVAIFKYPEFELEKIIYDERTSPIGNNGHNTGIVETENGDIYSYSSSALSGGFTVASKPSGVLRIKNGATEFDKDYFFNVEKAVNGGKIYWMDYVGKGKAIARIILDDTKGAYKWGTFLGNDVVKLVMLDFNKKTVTDIKGIPNHGQRYTAPVFKEDGKVYISVSDKLETRIYVVDPETATATKGAKAVNASHIKGIFKLEQ